MRPNLQSIAIGAYPLLRSRALLRSRKNASAWLRFVTPIVRATTTALEIVDPRPGQTNAIRAGAQLEHKLMEYAVRTQQAFRTLAMLHGEVAADIGSAISSASRGGRPTLFVDGSEASVRALIWLERNNIAVNEFHLQKPLAQSVAIGHEHEDGLLYYVVEGVPIRIDLNPAMEWPADPWGINERVAKIHSGEFSSPLLVIDEAPSLGSASDILARSEAMVLFGFDPKVYAAVFGLTPHEEVRIAPRDPSLSPVSEDMRICRGKDCNPLADAIVRYLSDNEMNHKVLDFGCGNGMDVEYFRAKMIDAQGYDPFYPDYCKESVLDAKYDIVMLRRVLNTIPDCIARERVLEQIRAISPKLLFVQVPGPAEERRWKRMRGQVHNDGFAILSDPKADPWSLSWPLWSFQRSFTREQLDALLERHGFVPVPGLLEMMDAGERAYKLSSLGYGSVVGVYKPR